MAYKKYFTLSFDDGLEQDKKIIAILKEYGLHCATFNLNSGLAGQRAAIGRVKELGYTITEDLSVLENDRSIIRYVEDHRIPADEIAEVYDGFEVASHAYLHESLPACLDEQAGESIRKDVETLKKLTGHDITGFAYPYGAYSDKVIDALKKNGIRYARAAFSTRSFKMPEDPYVLQPTLWMVEDGLFDTVQSFIDADPTPEDQMLYIWGHGYEFDFGTRKSNWDNLRRLCSMMAGRDDILCLANGEILAV